MSFLKSRVRNIEDKLQPRGLTIITGGSEAEVEQKVQEYLDAGGDPNQLITIIAEPIKKRKSINPVRQILLCKGGKNDQDNSHH